jgi:deoxycytidylate deaminase
MSAIPEENHQVDSKAADKILRDLSANELVFAVVGPVGSGTSWISTALEALLRNEAYRADVHIIKASDVITTWAKRTMAGPSSDHDTLQKVTALQNAGDRMREKDRAAVALELISLIRNKRQGLGKGTTTSTTTVTAIASKLPPETVTRRVYILDSLKHPAEVELLRSVYKEAFCLIGVVCEEEVREERLAKIKCPDSSLSDVRMLMKRDEDADIAHGQKVKDTFHLADFFVHNSPDRYKDIAKKVPNPAWDVPEQLGRLVDLLTFKKVIRPTPSETGMFHAYGAKMRSACLSRQVGAALLDGKGNVIATGTNEVPRAGGGVYGGNFEDFDAPEDFNDHRCVTINKYCSSNRSQDHIIENIINEVSVLKAVSDKRDLANELKKTPIGKLLEFSRAVHAEMDALISAARLGASTVGTRLFVTTFPCHYCARHIVSAGVDEVQYIEPYPKSKALDLHGDAITQSPVNWVAPSASSPLNAISEGKERKVLFRPFTGVAPRLYRQAFLKDRKLKNESGDFVIGDSDSASGLLKLSYQDVEEAVLQERER